MAGFVETIKIVVETTTNKASGDLKKLGADVKEADGAFGKLKAGAGGVGDFLKNNVALGVAAGGAAVAAFGVKAINASQDLALAAGKFADATGLTVEQSSKWIEVAGDIGIEAGTLESAFGKMAKAIGANPAKFDEFGIAVVRAKDGTIDMNATVLNAIDALNQTPDAAERAKLGSDLFGRGWQSVAELVEQGSTQIKASLDAVSDSKIVNEKELARAKSFRETMDTLNDSLEDVTISVGQVAVQTAGPLLSALGSVAGPLASLIGQLSDTNKDSGFGQQIISSTLNPLKSVTDGLSVAFDGSRDNIDRLQAGVATLAGTIPGISAVPFFDVETSAEKADKKLRALIEAAQLVEQGFDPAGRAAAGFVGDMSAAERQAALTAAAQRGLAEGVATAADAERNAQDAAEAYADEMERMAEASQVVLDAFLSLPDAIDDQAEAFAGMVSEVQKYNDEPTAENLANLEAKSKALAKADTDLARAQAEANGQQFNATSALDATNESYLKQVGVLKGPARQAILDRIGQLNGIKPEVITRIGALIAAGDIAGAETLLNSTSRARTAAINADANTSTAERELNYTARDRRAQILADVVTSGRGSGTIRGAFAQGGVARFAQGGVALVGERGPELVGLPDGSNVQPTERVRRWVQESIQNLTITQARESDSAFEARVLRALRGYRRHNGSLFSGSGI